MKTTSTMELAPVNQACHSASCLLHLAREEGDDGRETESPEAFLSFSFFWVGGRVIGFGIGREKGWCGN